MVLRVSLSNPNWYNNSKLKYITSFISVVESKIVTPTVKHNDITIYFLLEQFENSIFVLKYDKSSFITEDKCTKSCSGPIISQSNKCMTGFIFYIISNIEHYQLVRLHEVVVN